MKFIRLTNALLLHLKRFIVEFTPNYNVTYRKNQSPVDYNTKLNVSDYCAVDVSLPRNTKLIPVSQNFEKEEELVISRLSFESPPDNTDIESLDNRSTSTSSTSSSIRSLSDEKGRYSIKSVVH